MAAAASADLVESYAGPVRILEDEAFETNNTDFTVPSWREYDFLQFAVRDSNASDQIDRLSTLIPVAGLDSTGESRTPFNNNDEIRIERTDGSDVLQLNITGWSGHPTTADVLTIYGIRSGVEGGRRRRWRWHYRSEHSQPRCGLARHRLQHRRRRDGAECERHGGGAVVSSDKTILDNAGGLLRFGTVDPTSTDGNDRDTWINTTDGSFWSKANGAWTKQFTFGPDLGDHTRRAAISTDTTLEQTEYDNGTTSVTQDITIPTWTGANRYVFVGVPEAEDDITDIEQNGVSVFGGFEAAPDFGSHKWWRTSAAQNIFASGVTYTLIQ